MKLVQIPTTRTWINPEYVTNVREYARKDLDYVVRTYVSIEFLGQAGHINGIRKVDVTGVPVEEILAVLEGTGMEEPR